VTCDVRIEYEVTVLLFTLTHIIQVCLPFRPFPVVPRFKMPVLLSVFLGEMYIHYDADPERIQENDIPLTERYISNMLI
jgi:hypothetical protein